MTNVEALKALYAALGGTAADVANAVTIVDVLNALAALFEGDDDATTNADAIASTSFLFWLTNATRCILMSPKQKITPN